MANIFQMGCGPLQVMPDQIRLARRAGSCQALANPRQAGQGRVYLCPHDFLWLHSMIPIPFHTVKRPLW